MPFVQGSAIQSVMLGSFEHHIEQIHAAVVEHHGAPIRVVATHPDHVLAFSGEKGLLKFFFEAADGAIRVTRVKKSKAIPVIEDDAVASHVSGELRRVVSEMMSGNTPKRTQVRELGALLSKDEAYWLTDIAEAVEGIHGSDAPWFSMYSANVERIRSSMHGRIREIEATVPKTRYSKIPGDKMESFSAEIGDSMLAVRKVYEGCLECSAHSFAESNRHMIPVRDSLIAEAQTAVGLLGKAEKLKGQDWSKAARVHDQLADRAKTMAVVAAYTGTKAQPKEN